MRRVGVLVLAALWAGQFPATAMAALGDQLFTLKPIDAAFGDDIGQTVDIDGNLAIVGASGDDPVGAAYIFDVATGQQLLKLAGSDIAEDDYFGSAVAISGSIAVVGAPGNNFRGSPNPMGTGAAYVFDAITGEQRFKLTANDARDGDEFGWSVRVHGNTAIVGAPNNDDFGSTTGSAYLFDVTTGKQTFKLLGHDTEARDSFGLSVDIDGQTAIVGARWDDDAGEASGSAYLFDVSTGQQLHKLTAEDAARADRLGISVGISGNTAIAGAFADDDAGKSSGSAYLFDVTTGQQTFKLTADDAAQVDHFGWSTAVSGNTAVVGSISDRDNGFFSGSAYLFDAGTGKQFAKLIADDGIELDQFGRDVAIDGDRIIVGAPQLALGEEGAIDTFTGKAYLFDAVVPEPSSIVTCLIGILALMGNRRFPGQRPCL